MMMVRYCSVSELKWRCLRMNRRDVARFAYVETLFISSLTVPSQSRHVIHVHTMSNGSGFIVLVCAS